CCFVWCFFCFALCFFFFSRRSRLDPLQRKVRPLRELLTQQHPHERLVHLELVDVHVHHRPNPSIPPAARSTCPRVWTESLPSCPHEFRRPLPHKRSAHVCGWR